MNVHQIVEAVLFAADAPLTAEEIARADEGLDEDQVETALSFLRAEYDDAERAFQVVELGEGYQILTRPEFAPYLERFDNVPRPSRLSGPALETLAIIAYRQPIGRVEVEYIRGVGSSGVIKTLQDRQLIDVVGRAEGLGRPLLYGTTNFFLQHFGFRSLEDLPRPEELPVVLRERTPLGLGDDEESEQEEMALEAATPDDGGEGAEEGGEAGAENDEDGATASRGENVEEQAVASGGEDAEDEAAASRGENAEEVAVASGGEDPGHEAAASGGDDPEAEPSPPSEGELDGQVESVAPEGLPSRES